MRLRWHIAFLLPLVWFAVACNGTQLAPEPNATPGDSLPVRVVYSVTNTIFPEHWRRSPISAKFQRLDTAEEKRSSQCIQAALAKYPEKMLERNLKNVYVLKTINFYNVGFGATYYEKNLYIANNGVAQGYTNLFIEQSVHHEFSSILFFAYASSFNKTGWMQCNPAGFEYKDEATGGVQSLKDNKDGTYFSSYYNEQGFLDQYSQSSMENDVNELAQQLFCPEPGFWRLVERYPNLKCKVDKLVAFYHSIDDTFTLEYFKKFDTN